MGAWSMKNLRKILEIAKFISFSFYIMKTPVEENKTLEQVRPGAATPAPAATSIAILNMVHLQCSLVFGCSGSFSNPGSIGSVTY